MTAVAQNNDLTVTIQNQRQDSTLFTFDIFLNTTGGTTYLGDDDFVIDFDNAGKWNGNATLSLSNVFNSPSPQNVAIDTLASGRLTVNVQPILGGTATSEYPAIGTTPVRFATVTISGVNDFSADPGLSFVTGSGLSTVLFEIYHNGTKLQQAKVTSPVLISPAAGTAPVSAPANFVVASTSLGSTDLTWDVTTDSILIVGRAGSAVTTGPLNTIKYDGNPVFGSGEKINAGANAEFVVARQAGSDNTATISGLEAGINYHFAIYEFTGGNGRTEAYGPAAVLETTSIDSEPLSQPAAISFSNILETTLTAMVDTTGGNGSNIIVLGYLSGTTPIPSLVDGTTYTASSAYGAEELDSSGVFILYAGSAAGATNINITGLTAGTEYTFAAYAYNDDNGTTGAENYLTTAPTTADQYTMFPEPTTALNALTAIANGVNSITLSWADPGETENNWIIVARESVNGATAPAEGLLYTADTIFATGDAIGNGYVVYSGNASEGEVTVRGLDQNESYAFDIYAYTGNSAGDTAVVNYSDNAHASDTAVTWIGTAITAILEGPFDGTDMGPVSISVPSAQPYNIAPWNYTGTENNSSMPANTVDWVLIELRSGSTADSAATIVATQAALLLEDGSIVAADGTSTPVFEITLAGDYYVAVHHRNHLAVSSVAALTDGGENDFTYDFTTAGATGTTPMIQVAGQWLMYAGRLDLSTTAGIIDAGDYSKVYNDRNTAGTYEQSDVNMDGVVDANDRAAVFNNNGMSEQLPE